MPELRKDPTHGRWVIIATQRARRPGNFVSPEPEGLREPQERPFCEGNEHQTPPEIFALRDRKSRPDSPGWQVRVVPSIKPLLTIEGDFRRRGYGMYDVMRGVGAHEIIVETPQHTANMADLEAEQIRKVLDTYILRMNDLEKDKRFKYALAYKNYGLSAGGGAIRHSRSQIIASPVNPLRVKEELSHAREYYRFRDRCLYCDLIRQEIETRERIVVDAEHFVAVTAFASRFAFEIWILPKRHHCDFAAGAKDQTKDLALILKTVLRKIKVGLGDPAYNFVIHTAPFRREEKQGTHWRTIDDDYHWHIEVMPRLTRVAGFERGTGFYICAIPPEAAAEYLRETEV